MVRQGSAKALCVGSIPTLASSPSLHGYYSGTAPHSWLRLSLRDRFHLALPDRILAVVCVSTTSKQTKQDATMMALARYWATDYDWRKVEVKLNALPQFISLQPLRVELAVKSVQPRAMKIRLYCSLRRDGRRD